MGIRRSKAEKCAVWRGWGLYRPHVVVWDILNLPPLRLHLCDVRVCIHACACWDEQSKRVQLTHTTMCAHSTRTREYVGTFRLLYLVLVLVSHVDVASARLNVRVRVREMIMRARTAMQQREAAPIVPIRVAVVDELDHAPPLHVLGPQLQAGLLQALARRRLLYALAALDLAAWPCPRPTK
jgi:hypothetical protein